jgi:hypothetical protein
MHQKLNDKVEIKVSDNSKGILKKYWIKSFNPFLQQSGGIFLRRI